MEKERNEEKRTGKYGPGWNHDFHEIGIKIGDCAVHVDNDRALKEYMGLRFSRAMELAEQTKRMYRKEKRVPLKVKNTSLAVELLGHFAIQEVCFRTQRVAKHLPGNRPVMKFCDWLIMHMDVIDCGEAHCDNNRFLWDAISKPVSAAGTVKRSVSRRKLQK